MSASHGYREPTPCCSATCVTEYDMPLFWQRKTARVCCLPLELAVQTPSLTHSYPGMDVIVLWEISPPFHEVSQPGQTQSEISCEPGNGTESRK